MSLLSSLQRCHFSSLDQGVYPGSFSELGLSKCIDFKLNNLLRSEHGDVRHRLFEITHSFAIKIAEVVSDLLAFGSGGYFFFKLVVFSVDGVYSFLAQMAVFFRFNEALDEPDHWMP